jgi:hypothetical protein
MFFLRIVCYFVLLNKYCHGCLAKKIINGRQWTGRADSKSQSSDATAHDTSASRAPAFMSPFGTVAYCSGGVRYIHSLIRGTKCQNL